MDTPKPKALTYTEMMNGGGSRWIQRSTGRSLTSSGERKPWKRRWHTWESLSAKGTNNIYFDYCLVEANVGTSVLIWSVYACKDNK